MTICGNVQSALDTYANRVHHPGVQTSGNPQDSPQPSIPVSQQKRRYDISKHHRQGSDIAKLLNKSGNRRMDRDALLKRLDSLVRNKETPIQYLAALSSLYAELNMWKRQPDDKESKTSICDMLSTWKREDGGEYAGLMNQQGVSEANRIGVSSANVGAQTSAADGGEPPKESTPAEALDPLTPRHSPEKVSQSVDSKGVNANQPEDGWME